MSSGIVVMFFKDYRNAEQLIWTRLVALLVHLITTLQWEVELIP